MRYCANLHCTCTYSLLLRRTTRDYSIEIHTLYFINDIIFDTAHQTSRTIVWIKRCTLVKVNINQNRKHRNFNLTKKNLLPTVNDPLFKTPSSYVIVTNERRISAELKLLNIYLMWSECLLLSRGCINTTKSLWNTNKK